MTTFQQIADVARDVADYVRTNPDAPPFTIPEISPHARAAAQVSGDRPAIDRANLCRLVRPYMPSNVRPKRRPDGTPCRLDGTALWEIIPGNDKEDAS